MIAPLMLIRAVLPAMRQRRFGRHRQHHIRNGNDTPPASMTLSSGARGGLTAAMKGLSLEIARDNVTINNLLPERFDTDRQHQIGEGRDGTREYFL